MKKLTALILLFSAITAFAVNAQETNAVLSNKYYVQAKAAENKKDFSNAIQLLEKSIQYNPNNDEAFYLLAHLTGMTFEGHPSNFNKATEYEMRSANLGNQKAKENLSSAKLAGLIDASDDEIIQARSEIEAALINQPRDRKIYSLLALIISYESGLVEFRDLNKAEYYANQLMGLPLTQEQKNSFALNCFYLSLGYMVGTLKEKRQPQKSFQWMKVAADWGLKEANYNLSDMYFYGYGTLVDYEKSYQAIKKGDQLEWQLGSLRKKHIFPFIYTTLFYLTRR